MGNKWDKQQHAMMVKDQQRERKHAKQISAARAYLKEFVKTAREWHSDPVCFRKLALDAFTEYKAIEECIKGKAILAQFLSVARECQAAIGFSL